MNDKHARHQPPHRNRGLYLSDAGIETTLIFLEGLELPDFAAFLLLRDAAGEAQLERYFRRHMDIARSRGLGFVFESATWRASPDWAQRQGVDAAELERLNRRAIEMLLPLCTEFESGGGQAVISGCVGPRGDGYVPRQRMSADEARAYHAPQIDTYAAAGADFVSAITMNYPEEAIGITQAAQAAGLPAVISFTVETDGRLPTGDALAQAIAAVDAAAPGAVAYYMINCAHPTHFVDVLRPGAAWLARIGGVRANASRRSHAELNEAPDLDAGNPSELADEYRALLQLLPNLAVLGGCCGTDHRHIEAIGRRCTPDALAA
jgi:S-methylmethionine-dependent homocysteine/selenocysteine methylase